MKKGQNSTCHWCHVLSHESFEDAGVAALLNKHFICIKVDREERPDIDAVYMAVCQALTGSGGWPLSIFMTPDQKPFYAGTYFPRETRYGRIGMIELLTRIVGQWKNNRTQLLEAGEKITDYLQNQAAKQTTAGTPRTEFLRQAAENFRRSYDESWGGFGSAPKFPMPHNLLFLMRYGRQMQDAEAFRMAEKTLVHMYRGGIFDHLGGGFSRYSTDDRWLIPHFEKMLYDNALLVYAYQTAYELTGNTLYRSVTERVLDYVCHELTDPAGGFYCGQDADSEGEEGKYYGFTPREIQDVLGKEEGRNFCQYFGITKDGNFKGKSIPNLLQNPNFMTAFEEQKENCRRLYEHRLRRYFLHKDDKILTSWNGLMIAAMARAGRDEYGAHYLEAAKKAQGFLQAHLTDESGRLRIRWRDGEASHEGQLDDYAFYCFGLLELYQTTYQIEYLQECIRLAEQMCEHFEDREAGGFYLYASDSEQLISRPKEVYDGALPSGNSVAAYVLGRLTRLTGELRWQETLDRQIAFLAGRLQEYPSGHSFALLAMQEALTPSRELVCVTADTRVPDPLETLEVQNLTVLLKTPDNQKRLTEAAPFTADYPIPKAGTLYYLCENGACRAPADWEGIQTVLGLA